MLRVIPDILPDTMKGPFVSDDVFIVVALPDEVNIRVRVKPFRHADLVPPDDRPDRP